MGGHGGGHLCLSGAWPLQRTCQKTSGRTRRHCACGLGKRPSMPRNGWSGLEAGCPGRASGRLACSAISFVQARHGAILASSEPSSYSNCRLSERLIVSCKGHQCAGSLMPDPMCASALSRACPCNRVLQPVSLVARSSHSLHCCAPRVKRCAWAT